MPKARSREGELVRRIRLARFAVIAFVVLMGLRSVFFGVASLHRNRATFRVASLCNRLTWRAERTLQLAAGPDSGSAAELANALGDWAAESKTLDRELAADGLAAAPDLRELHSELASLYARLPLSAEAQVRAGQYAEKYEARLEKVVAEVRSDSERAGVDAARAQLFGLVLIVAALALEAQFVLRAVIARTRRYLQIERKSVAEAEEKKAMEVRERELRVQNRELERLAGTDALTGLPNRRALITWLRREAELLSQSGRTLGVLMIDLDHFKVLNDKYGHQAGDDALRAVGQAIQRCIRGTDLAARYGGEEFVVLLPRADEVDTVEIAEVIRESISSLSGEYGRLRASVGAASGTPEFDGDALIRAADRALYEAKRSGRDRTVLARAQARQRAPAAPSN